MESAATAIRTAQKSVEITPSSPFEAKAIIYRAGTPAPDLYQLISGRVVVYIPDKTGKKDDSSFLRLYGPGDYFGEESLERKPEARWGTAEVLNAAEIKVMPKIWGQCQRDSELATKLFCLALAWAKEERKMAEICAAHNKVVERVAELLLHYGERFGIPQNNGIYLEPLTHSVIGSMIGTGRELITMSMTTLRKKGCISYSHKEIIIKPAIREWLAKR